MAELPPQEPASPQATAAGGSFNRDPLEIFAARQGLTVDQFIAGAEPVVAAADSGIAPGVAPLTTAEMLRNLNAAGSGIPVASRATHGGAAETVTTDSPTVSVETPDAPDDPEAPSTPLPPISPGLRYMHSSMELNSISHTHEEAAVAGDIDPVVASERAWKAYKIHELPKPTDGTASVERDNPEARELLADEGFTDLRDAGEKYADNLTEFVTTGYSTFPGIGWNKTQEETARDLKVWAAHAVKDPEATKLLPVLANIRRTLEREKQLRANGWGPDSWSKSTYPPTYKVQTDTDVNIVGYEIRALDEFADALVLEDPVVGELFKRDAGLWEEEESEPGMVCDLDALRDILINSIVPEGEEVDAESTEWATIMLLRKTGEYLSRRENDDISDEDYDDMLRGRALDATPEMVPIIAETSRKLRARFEEASAALEADNDEEPNDDHIREFDNARFAIVDLDDFISVGLKAAHPELFDQVVELEMADDEDAPTAVMPDPVQPTAQPARKGIRKRLHDMATFPARARREKLSKHPKIAAKVGAITLATAIRFSNKEGSIVGNTPGLTPEGAYRTVTELENGTQSSDEIQRESVVPREIAIEMTRLRMEEEAVKRSGGRVSALTASRMFDRLHDMLGGGRDDVVEFAEATKRLIHDELISNPGRRMPSPDDPEAMSKYASAVVTRARRVVSANSSITSREVQDGYALAVLNQIFTDKSAQEIHDELLG